MMRLHPKTVLIASLPAPMSNMSGFLSMAPPVEWQRTLRQRAQQRRANKRAARLSYLQTHRRPHA